MEGTGLFASLPIWRPFAATLVLAIGAVACALGCPAWAAAETRNVLVLYSSGRLLPANVEGDRGLREVVQGSAARSVEIFDEFLDVSRFSEPAYDRIFATYLREKYATRQPDVVVAGATEALGFLLRHRATLFPQITIVHLGVPRSFLVNFAPLPADVIGVPIEYDSAGTIEQALRWHPQARRLVIVTGKAAWDREWELRLRNEASRLGGRIAVEFLAGLSTSDVLGRMRELGRDTVVFTTGYFEDGEGRYFTPRESAAAIVEAAAAPVYGPFNTFIGVGIVGGNMPNYASVARQAGHVVNELLDGATPASLRLPEIAPSRLNVDWRQVQRWGIDEKAIPADAIVHFRAPSFLEQYRNETIIALVVFLLQAALIASLLVERRLRRQAEEAVQKHRSDLAHASRMAIVAELTGSIAHEINQPLGAILSNADAADLILASGADRRDKLREILTDIRRDDLRASEVIRRLRALLGKHEVERSPFELNEALREVEALLRTEARRRRVTLDMRPAKASITVIGDRIQVQQVLINLVLNAMDAVTDAPDDRRTVVVTIERLAGAIGIAVRDTGHGIAAGDLPKLFDSFFTTKPEGMGMGLSIARSIVETHGGRVWAENGPGGGAVFHVELPAAGGTVMRPGGPA